MVFDILLQKNSKGSANSGRMENRLSSPARRGTKFPDRLKYEPNFSYADIRSETLKIVDNFPPTSSGNHQKLEVERKAIENEELVKYMSNLPSYLERGESIHEKAFNVGVLEWHLLEKWQYSQKQFPLQSNRYSPPSSNNSSFFSTDESSTPSMRDHSCSPARLKMHQPTLLSHRNASPKEVYFQGKKSFTGNVGNFQDLRPTPSDLLKGQQSITRADRSFIKGHSENKLKEFKRSAQQVIPEMKTSLGVEKYVGASASKGKMKIQEGESTNKIKKKGPYYDITNDDWPEQRKTFVPLLCRDGAEKSHSAISYPFDPITTNGRRSSEANRRSFSEASFPNKICHAELYSHDLHLCSLPCEVDSIKHLQMRQPGLIDEKNINLSSEPSHSSSCTAKISVSPSRGNNMQEKSSTLMSRNSTLIKSSGESELKMGIVHGAKMRNPSPPQAHRIGLGRMGRISGSNDVSSISQVSFKDVTAKSGSGKAVAPACLDNSSSNTSNDNGRARSSPLRRLLDPLLKPKAANSPQLAETLRRDSSSTESISKSSNRRVESSSAHPMKLKLHLTSCKAIKVDDAHQNEKHGSPMVQALLQIAIKNGLPLFTFAVDNSDILAATMRKSSPSRKDENSWIYTFFSIHEVKKKSSWINHGGKSKGKGYIPNVVAQMKVSDSLFPKLIKHSVDQLSIKEFVLFSVDLRQSNQQTLDLQPNDELAAIVVKFSEGALKSLNKYGQQNDSSNYPSGIGLKEPFPVVRGNSNSRDERENGSSSGSQDSFSMTVILPGGIHGLPSKGEPASLIERWNSGGSCDCGGWDLGCRLRVFSNQTQLCSRSSSLKTHPSEGRFELFSQGEVLDDRPVFSMSQFKDGFFSVEFSSPLALLEAFSICLAVLNSRKPNELSGLSNLFGEKSSEENTMENDGTRAPNRIQVEVPAKYATNPPLSPVGRV